MTMIYERLPLLLSVWRCADAGPSKPAAQKVVTEAPHMHLPSILPPQVAQQIRSAQQKAALSGIASQVIFPLNHLL